MDEAPRVAEIEFLYLDLSSCGPCVASDASLREAVALLEPALGRAGIGLRVRSIQVTSARQAQELRIESSPTIRVNGTDIAGELAEAECGDCTGLSAGSAPVACRAWRWQGRQYTQAPAGLIIDAVLRRLYGNTPVMPQAGYGGLPENLAGFFGTPSGVPD